MKITIKNYTEEINKIGLKKLNTEQAKAHENIIRDMEDGIFDELMADNEYADVVNGYFKSLEKILSDNKTKKTTGTAKADKKTNTIAKKAVPKTRTKKTSVKTVRKKDDNVKYVESIDIEVSLIKRFALLHNKTKSVEQLTNLLTALKKAILQKKIRANSVFAKEIRDIEKRLAGLIDYAKSEKADGVKINIGDYEKFKEVGNSEKVIKAITYIIRYMGLINKPDIDIKAENLLKNIKSALKKGDIDKKYMDTIKFIQSNLSKLDDNRNLLEIPETTLQGLSGLTGLNGFSGLGSLSSIIEDISNPVPEMVAASELAKMSFDTVELEPEFEEVIGRPSTGSAIMVFGEPGSGKSSFALLFAKSMAEQGKKILYVTSEEGINPTMQEKILRFGASLPNLIITSKIPGSFEDYDSVVFDSAQSLNISPDFIENNKNVIKDIGIYVFQVTKGGVFRGAKDFEHVVDVVLNAKSGVVSSNGFKNRFGGNGEMRVF